MAQNGQSAGSMTNSKPITVKVNIEPGPASLAQKHAWKLFWQLIAETNASNSFQSPDNSSEAPTK